MRPIFLIGDRYNNSPRSCLRSRARRGSNFLNMKDLRRRSCDDYLQNLQAATSAGFGVTFHRDGVILVEKGKGHRDKLDELLAQWPGCH